MEQNLYGADLSPALFTRFATLLLEQSGITLKDHKKYLLIHRLSKMVGPDKQFHDYESYYQALLEDRRGDLIKGFVNVLTTNFSFFFRENIHFDFLKEYLREHSATPGPLRFWSAASSTGEESYSMAISIQQAMNDYHSRDIKILASDISTKVLNIARQGSYRYTKVRGHIDDKELRRFFTFDKTNNSFIVKPDVRNLIAFRHLNLFDPFPFSRQFDIVFLRNVLIYFDNQEKEIIINKIFDHIKPGGYLILGLSESLVGIKHTYKHKKNSIYQK